MNSECSLLCGDADLDIAIHHPDRIGGNIFNGGKADRVPIANIKTCAVAGASRTLKFILKIAITQRAIVVRAHIFDSEIFASNVEDYEAECIDLDKQPFAIGQTALLGDDHVSRSTELFSL